MLLDFFIDIKIGLILRMLKTKKDISAKFAIDTRKDLQNLLKFVKNKDLNNFTIYKI